MTGRVVSPEALKATVVVCLIAAVDALFLY